MTTIYVPQRTAHDPEPHSITFPTQADADAYQRRLDEARRAFYEAYCGIQTPQTDTREHEPPTGHTPPSPTPQGATTTMTTTPTTALMIPDTHLDTLFTAGLLCTVCEERPWTQPARTCAAHICASCAEGEPDDADDETLTHDERMDAHRATLDGATAWLAWELDLDMPRDEDVDGEPYPEGHPLHEED